VGSYIEGGKDEFAFGEAHYRGLYDKLSDAFSFRKVIMDENGRPVDLEYVCINPAFEKHFGLSADEIVGKRFTEVFSAGDEERRNWIEAIGNVAVTGQSAAYEQFLAWNGRWYRVSNYTFEPGYVATISHDITDRKHAEKALIESELRYRLLFENINEAVILIEIAPDGTPGRIREVNEMACRRLGYSREELLELSVSDIDPSLTSEDWKIFASQLKAEGVNTFERIHRAKDGTLIPVEICSKHFILGGTEFSLTIDRDLRERIRTEKMVKASYERMRRSHFFNELIKTPDISPQRVQEMVLTTGLKLPEVLSCYLVVIEEWEGKSQSHWQQHPYELYLLMNSVIESLENDESWIAWASPYGIGVLHAGFAADGDEKTYQEEVARQLRGTIEGNIPDLTVKIGVAASAANPADLRDRYRQSHIAVNTGRKIWPERYIYHYLDMGIFQLLPFVDQAEVTAYVERTLGTLLHYEKKKKTEFLMTLEVILESTSLTEAAKKLFIHQKTLEFRKRRIEQILGVLLNRHETRTALVIALKLLKMNEGKNK
jgi:PAS domain S-box-containing protein